MVGHSATAKAATCTARLGDNGVADGIEFAQNLVVPKSPSHPSSSSGRTLSLRSGVPEDDEEKDTGRGDKKVRRSFLETFSFVVCLIDRERNQLHTPIIMNHDAYDNAYISGILTTVKTVAIVGASANDVRPSFFVLQYLLAKGFSVFPVNPGHAGKEILGRMTYARLSDIPEPVDMVDIFRPSSAVPAIVEEALALKPLPKVIWMQLTVRHDEAAARAEAAGVKVVMNRCPKIEYGRLSGEIGWNGVNSGVLSSKKPVARARFQSLGIRAR